MATDVRVPGTGKGKKLYPSGRAGPLPGHSSTVRLNDLAQPLIESFNYMLDDGLRTAVTDLQSRELKVSSGQTLRLWLEEVTVHKPTKTSDGSVTDSRLFPSECRERGLTYAAPMTAILCKQVNDGEVQRQQVQMGQLPIMTRSNRCHLHGLRPAQLIAANEEASEFGGYFICNGIERIIRMLQIPKRNYPMAITRGAYTNRGPLYSNKGVVIRCARPDQSSVTLTLHYLTDGSCTVRFAVKKQEFFLPAVLVLYALSDTTDRDIYERVLAGERGNTYLADRVLMLLRDAKKLGPALASRVAALTYLGARFRAVLDLPEYWTDAQAGQELLDRYVLVHLGKGVPAGRDKATLLLLMLRKLYGFVAGRVGEDNADALTNQELLLGGNLLLTMVKEKLDEYTAGIVEAIRKEDMAYTRSLRSGAASARASAIGGKASKVAAPVNLADSAWFRKVLDRQPEVGKKVAYLLATGNLISSSGLDLMQVSGYTVVADKINFLRFTTHFRSVHRGQFFAEMKTTLVRRLLPENWGFLCPVHTPDGGPCGLLNHLSAPCSVVAQPISDADYAQAARKAAGEDSKSKESKVPSSVASGMLQLLVSLGMTPHAAQGTVLPADELPILLDGKVLGSAPPHAAYTIAKALRRRKALTAAVHAGLERVGDGPIPGQAEAVASLTRAAVVGKTDTQGAQEGVGLLHLAVGDGDSRGPLGGLRIPVPPSMEVAFIPPSWWEPEVDQAITEDAVAQARAARCALLAVSGEGAQDEKARSEESKKEDDSRAGPADDDALPPTRVLGPFPGLFLSVAPQRPVRPVIQLDTGLVELVSPLEQPYLDIAIWPKDLVDVLQQEPGKKKDKGSKPGGSALSPGPYSHIELSPTAMLSEVAQLTPFSDMNQSPRNMYQCQMGKQTMGTPLHSYVHRTDTKLFRLTTPQAAIVQNAAQAALGIDEYPAGANACVAVIAYTGYDMEDACIINKGSYERGFGWASVYKTYDVDLLEKATAADAYRYCFHNTVLQGEAVRGEKDGKGGGNKRAGDLVFDALDADGLPPIGTKLTEGTPLYAVLDRTTKSHRVVKHKDLEPAYVDEVRILGSAAGSAQGGMTRVSIKLRYDRRPVVGDKFSSRHGQKGVLSYLWPSEDMPFTESGQTPDVIINPHAFPSRMTIGMLVESMAGKAGALHGRFQDATPFRFDEDNRVVDYFGAQLRAAGYAYGGSETMYSGVTGEPLPVDIYYGVVYYQRLRHMVKDKAQVRSTGPSNALTAQPVKGRKKGGGIRFGEMERDSLLAHGAAFLLHDRLHSSSDRHIALVCGSCGSVVAPHSVPARQVTHMADGSVVPGGRGGAVTGGSGMQASEVTRTKRVPVCRACGTGAHIRAVPMPYVFRYLANELAAMGVRIVLELGEGPYAPQQSPGATMTLGGVKEKEARR